MNIVAQVFFVYCEFWNPLFLSHVLLLNCDVIELLRLHALPVNFFVYKYNSTHYRPFLLQFLAE